MIAETNYCAHAIDTMQKILRSNSPYSAGLIPQVVMDLKSAIKFRLPENGSLLYGTAQQRHEWGRTYSRLPYPIIALEWTRAERQATAGGVFQMMDSSGEMFTEVASGEACGVQKHVMMCKEGPLGIEIYSIVSSDVTGGLFGLHPYCCIVSGEKIIGRALVPSAPKANAHDIGMDFAKANTVLCEFLAATACSNVSTSAVDEPAVALNKKRTAAGKQPFFSYRVLEIGCPSSQSQSLGGTHASPRIHLRRGHIRRLTDRTVWVNACVVGNKALGMVAKDYAVRPSETPCITDQRVG